MTKAEALRARADKKRLSSMTRHVLVCVGDDCDEKSKIVKRLKKRVASAGARADITTTKVDCLGICSGGPIVVVYPEGTWYGGVTGAIADRIVDEHLLGGQPVAEHAFMRNPLCVAAAHLSALPDQAAS